MVITSITGWTSSIASCPAIAFTLVKSDDSADTSGIFGMAGTDLDVYTINPVKIATYNMKLVGTVTGYDTKFVLFTVIVEDGCTSMTLTPTTITSP